MRGHPLVEQAQATLCRLADAPPAADAATAAIADIERSSEKPYSVGIGGELPARSELINFLCGARVLDPQGREKGGAAVRVVRGATTSFRAARDDGTVEAQALPPDRTKDIAAANARAEAARGELAEQETAIERVAPSLPARPPWWAIWLWIRYLLAWWRAHRHQTQRKLADLAIVEGNAKVDALEKDAAGIEAQGRLAKQRYFESLKKLASGGPIGSGILEVTITLAQSPLPEGVEIVELAGTSRAGADVDAVLLVKDGQLCGPATPPFPLGDFAAALAALPALLADARALRIARRVQLKITSAMASLHDAIERKESTFRDRIGRVQAMRIDDPIELSRQLLEGVRSEISASISAVVEHASVHLGSELAQLQNDWIGWVATAEDTEALKAAIAKIEEQWAARPKQVAEEVRVLVVGGLGGSARDIYPKVATPLVEHGLSQEHVRLRAAPEIPPVQLFPSLTQEPAKLEKSSWLTGLFRSFDARRSMVRERVHDRVERMREIAGSELLDAEPRLHHAISAALATLLEAAITRQQENLDTALDVERAAIASERQSIAPLIAVHDSVRAETGRLAQHIAQLEREKPAVAVAAAAAETASLSR